VTGSLTYAQVRMLQEARESSSGQVFVADDTVATSTAQKLVASGLGVLVHGYFIVNQAGTATACMWPKAA
jgi:hypothetical protein